MADKNSDIFSDIDISFIAHPITGQLPRKTNRQSVIQSVKSLIQTDYFERFFQEDIGCSIRYLLFELWSPAIKQQMENAIRDVIRNHEPRAQVFEVLVEDEPANNRVTASIAFMLVNDPDPVVLDVFLERVR